MLEGTMQLRTAVLADLIVLFPTLGPTPNALFTACVSGRAGVSESRRAVLFDGSGLAFKPRGVGMNSCNGSSSSTPIQDLGDGNLWGTLDGSEVSISTEGEAMTEGRGKNADEVNWRPEVGCRANRPTDVGAVESAIVKCGSDC